MKDESFYKILIEGLIMSGRIESYEEFFPFYLREHANPGTRLVHYMGTTLGFACWGRAIYAGELIWFVIGFLVGYTFAWIGHFFIEKNKPASFKYPYWSFISDFKMYFLFLSGRISGHLDAALKPEAEAVK
jgi:hypothetical protein